jgi:acyl dehydratase
MHPLRLFFAAWLALGTATVFFLFWLCKRTAERISTLHKPVLDQDTFQQLLAAAYTLQEQNPQPVKETKADSSRTVSVPLESIPMAQSDVASFASRNHSPVPTSSDRRAYRSDKFFWRTATAVAVAAVFALLLVASTDRLSTIPAGLEAVHQEVPFHKVLSPNGRVAAKTTMMQPQMTRIEQSVVTDQARRRVSALTCKTTVNPIRHSIYESEANMVAPDTVMRYGKRAAAR